MRSCLIVLLFAVDCVVAAELGRPTGESIVSPDAKLELLFTRTAAISGGLTEGPAVAPDGSVYFTAIPVGKDLGMIMRFDPKTKIPQCLPAIAAKQTAWPSTQMGF